MGRIDFTTLRWRHLVEPNTALRVNPPPAQENCVDLTDAQWDHGASDGEIYAVLKRGVPPTMMPGFDGAPASSDPAVRVRRLLGVEA